jgi:hypothetical protein
MLAVFEHSVLGVNGVRWSSCSILLLNTLAQYCFGSATPPILGIMGILKIFLAPRFLDCMQMLASRAGELDAISRSLCGASHTENHERRDRFVPGAVNHIRFPQKRLPPTEYRH